MQTQLILTVDYDPAMTDPEGLASAMDRLLETALSTPGIMEEYGNTAIGEFFVAPTSESGQSARQTTSCECEAPGFYCSGVPGVLARVEDGRLVPGAKVERCDLCRRYPTDAAARTRLVELGIAPDEAHPRRYVLYDFDADELACTNVYDDYHEAAEDADQFDNVIVVTLPVPFPHNQENEPE